MSDQDKSREQLIHELETLRAQLRCLNAPQQPRACNKFLACALENCGMLQSLNSIILLLDVSHTILFINRFGLQFFGFEAHELIGQNVVGTIVPHTDSTGNDLAAMIADISVHPELYQSNENENKRKDGQRVWIAWTNRAVRDDSGTVQRILCVGNDISVRKSSEEVLQRRTLELQERVKELRCLYSILKLLELPDHSIDVLAGKIITLLPQALQYPDITAARIILEGQEFKTDNFEDTPWKLQEPVVVFGQKTGLLEICYLHEAPDRDQSPFMSEEIPLIRAIADQVGALMERNHAEQALKASEAKHKMLLENLPQRIFFKDCNSVYISCNRNYAEDLHINPDQINGKTDYDFFPAHLAEKYRADDRRIIHSGAIDNIEEQYLLDGREIIINTVKTPARDESGDITGILGMFWDITEKKQIEREKKHIEQALEQNTAFQSIKNEISELLLSSRQLNEILHMILIGVTANRALGFNRAFLFLINEDAQQLAGRVATGPLTSEEAHRTWSRLAQQDHSLAELFQLRKTELTTADEPIQLLVRQMKLPLDNPDSVFSTLTREQRSFNIKGGIRPPFADSPQFIELLGTDNFVLVPLVARGKTLGMLVADNLITRKPITDQHVQVLREFANHASLAIGNSRLYERLQEKVDELSRANRELEESHDKLVRYERLSAVGAVAAQVAHDIRNPLTAIGGFARRILKQQRDEDINRNYVKIIAREVDRMEHILGDLLCFSRPPELTKTPCDINALVSNSINVYWPELEQHKISYKEKLDPCIPVLELDVEHIKRVFDNLVKNALEAMEETGPGGELAIETSFHNDEIQVMVSDTGTGIDALDTDRIFEPFFTKKATGSGLGLTLSAQIVSAHRGTIAWKVREPLGTSFILTLPKA